MSFEAPGFWSGCLLLSREEKLNLFGLILEVGSALCLQCLASLASHGMGLVKRQDSGPSPRFSRRSKAWSTATQQHQLAVLGAVPEAFPCRDRIRHRLVSFSPSIDPRWPGIGRTDPAKQLVNNPGHPAHALSPNRFQDGRRKLDPPTKQEICASTWPPSVCRGGCVGDDLSAAKREKFKRPIS